MTTGEYIKMLRTGNNKDGRIWSQEELGHRLNPPVNRAAINKWESGTVENIRKTYIEQLAEIFEISPADLMCFDSKFDEQQISEEVKVIEQVNKYFGKDAVQLLEYFTELNEKGKLKALTTLGDLTEIPRYCKQV